MIQFTVEGSPIAQKRHKHTKSGHTYDPSKADKRLFLANALKSAPKKPLEKEVFLKIEFYIYRPKKHYRTGRYSHLLKNNPPYWHITRADIDNLLKLIMDALNGVYYKDDCQVCYVKMLKKYSANPRTVITVEGIE